MSNLIRNTVLFVSFLAASSLSYAAVPSDKVFNSNLSPFTCSDGRKGSKCFTFATIILTWDTPTQRVDGSSLSFNEISHYIIRKQRDAGVVVSMTVAKKNSIHLRYMPSGTYTFTIATVDSDRLRGPFSDSIQVTIN